MGFWSDLGSAIGSICSAIGSVCSAIGGAIASKIGALATTIAPFLGPVAQAVVAIAQIIGIFIKDDNVEDLGEAMRKADKKPEDFDSINDYITYLRAEIKSPYTRVAYRKLAFTFATLSAAITLPFNCPICLSPVTS